MEEDLRARTQNLKISPKHKRGCSNIAEKTNFNGNQNSRLSKERPELSVGDLASSPHRIESDSDEICVFLQLLQSSREILGRKKK